MGHRLPFGITPELVRKAKQVLQRLLRRPLDEPLEEALVGARTPPKPRPRSGRAAEPLP